jgi:hypothetical protein
MFLATSAAVYIPAIVWAVLGFAILFSMAKSRGRNPVLWGVFGAIAFLVALIVILIVGRADDAER